MKINIPEFSFANFVLPRDVSMDVPEHIEGKESPAVIYVDGDDHPAVVHADDSISCETRLLGLGESEDSELLERLQALFAHERWYRGHMARVATCPECAQRERELCPHVELTQDGARCMHCLEEVE